MFNSQWSRSQSRQSVKAALRTSSRSHFFNKTDLKQYFLNIKNFFKKLLSKRNERNESLLLAKDKYREKEKMHTQSSIDKVNPNDVGYHLLKPPHMDHKQINFLNGFS